MMRHCGGARAGSHQACKPLRRLGKAWHTHPSRSREPPHYASGPLSWRPDYVSGNHRTHAHAGGRLVSTRSADPAAARHATAAARVCGLRPRHCGGAAQRLRTALANPSAPADGSAFGFRLVRGLSGCPPLFPPRSIGGPRAVVGHATAAARPTSARHCGGARPRWVDPPAPLASTPITGGRHECHPAASTPSPSCSAPAPSTGRAAGRVPALPSPYAYLVPTWRAAASRAVAVRRRHAPPCRPRYTPPAVHAVVVAAAAAL